MSKLKIEGKNVLSGTIEISGAKNSAVALLPASLLCKTKSKIFKVPKIRDIEYLIKILEVLNCKCKIENNIFNTLFFVKKALFKLPKTYLLQKMKVGNL